MACSLNTVPASHWGRKATRWQFAIVDGQKLRNNQRGCAIFLFFFRHDPGYVIGHMEEDDETSQVVPPWVELEYAAGSNLAHMGTLADQGSLVHLTHLSSSSELLKAKFANVPYGGENLAKTSCHQAEVLNLIKEHICGSLRKVCLLDPEAEQELLPEDGDGGLSAFCLVVFWVTNHLETERLDCVSLTSLDDV
ncbi:hypothetical protein D9758_011952 [Tetrapyrgos nigripes]|uniref:Uncharacterized protein n=1 Tax=Tetrapyrgos nigripes TaxID=182062 RepID=A0A8H5D2D3_9AGAR|nr:hypothetical protein D9758_011952 [Tetrapyrgos nigripes]